MQWPAESDSTGPHHAREIYASVFDAIFIQ